MTWNMTADPQAVALVTGVNGMDGSHLVDLLIAKGYRVIGMERRSSTPNRTNTRHLEDSMDFEWVTGDLTDQSSIIQILMDHKPDEFYNLAAQSFVGVSWSIPEATLSANATGVLNCLEAIRKVDPTIRFYQASTSEMFGKMVENPARETTPFYPRSPYGVAKVCAYWLVRNYRESHGMHASNGILFNHESERRGHEFVTRKVTDGVARIALGLADNIALGNLESLRDWGYAPDYVEGMWRILQQDEPDDYVLATGVAHSIRDLLDIAFDEVGINDWEERGLVVQDPRFYRPAEVDVLCGDASKAREVLGWSPEVDFEEMVRRMVRNDMNLLGN